MTTGAVLSAASWIVLVRLRITCACCADNEARSSGDNSSSEASSLSDDGGDGGKGGKGGKGCDGGRDGSRPVFTNTQVGSVQPATIEGNAGGFDDEFGLLSAMNGSTVLPEPPLAVPLAEELVMVPTGKLEPGIDPAGN